MKVVTAVAVTLAVALGGCGDGSRPMGDAAISGAEVVAQTDARQQPVDATPSPDGNVIYYVATGEPAGTVFSVPAEGGAVTKLAEGAPLAEPSGISVSIDGQRLYVADARSGILTLPPTGGPMTPVALAGTEDYGPRGVDVTPEGVYFAGTRGPGLYRVSPDGGAVTTVADGAPFVAPDSVVAAADGTAYVTDHGSGPGQGLVYRVTGGTVEPVLTGLTLGAPAGVTLINDDATLLVSSIDPSSRSDQVLFLDLATGKTAAATKVIGANQDSSGGLHKAHDAAVLAWADVLRPGRVYRVDLA